MSTARKQWLVLLAVGVLLPVWGAYLACTYQAEVSDICRANPCDPACAKYIERRCQKACLANEPRTVPDECAEDSSMDIERCCQKACLKKEPRIVPEDCSAEPSMGNARFFAAQTITTTGYGSEIFLSAPDVQDLAFWGMAFGALLWAIFTTAFFSVLTTGGLNPRPK